LILYSLLYFASRGHMNTDKLHFCFKGAQAWDFRINQG
jgi:hypothetical protein